MRSIVRFFLFFLILAGIVAGLFYGGDKYLGLDQISFLKDKFGSANEGELEDKDDTPLEVEADRTERILLEGRASIIVKSNKEITVEQSNRITLHFIEEIDGIKYYVAEIGNIGLGSVTVKMTLNDSEGGSEELNIPLTRQAFGLPFGADQVEPWPNSTYEIDGEDLLANVNKGSRLTIDYAPKDLVDLNTEYFLYTNVSGITLRKEAAEYLKIMLTDMQSQINKNVVIASGYRSYNTQVETYTGWLKSLGQEEADKVSARPGFSEHQLGTSVDFINEESGFDFTAAFDTTPAGIWLKEHAWQYGYVQTYPEGKEDITRYSYEAWHYRYIGIDNAKKWKESGLTLVEYINNL